MSNLNYEEWRSWVENTYPKDSLLNPVFNKLLDAWQAEREQVQKELLIFQNAGLEYKQERDLYLVKLKKAKGALKEIEMRYKHGHGIGAGLVASKALKQLEDKNV